MKLFFLGLLVQLVFLISVFDIYLKTKVVNGVEPEGSCSWSAGHGSAKRLVLIVSDGLRSDVLFTIKEELSLRKVMTERGRWGISKARMPTRSVQCLQAMGSGMYSDPLAYLDLWQRLAPQPDTIFDRATSVFYFGHPVVPYYFTSTLDNWHVLPQYDIDWKKLRAGKSTAYLDEYVLDRFYDYLQTAKNDTDLVEELNRRGTIIMIHLSGVDKAAHQTGPLSKATRDNVLAVDRGVARVEMELKEFYGDEDTAFLFTSDHGATKWGSHGGSSPEETDTPLIVWGPGIGAPTWDGDPDASPAAWRLGNLTCRNVTQVDLAPLMASLLGVPVPVNSIGILPDDYLDSEELKARSVACNAFQLAALAAAEGRSINRGFFKLLSDPRNLLANNTAENISRLIERGCYKSAIGTSKELIRAAVEAFHYYHGYYTSKIYALIMSSFVAWCIVLLSHMLPTYTVTPVNSLCAKCQKEKEKVETSESNPNIKPTDCGHLSTRGCRINRFGIIVHAFFATVSVGIIAMLIITSWPLSYYIYVILFIGLWWIAFSSVMDWFNFLSNIHFSTATTIFWISLIYVFLVELLLWSFTLRYPISAALILAIFMTRFRAPIKNTDHFVVLLWYTSAAALEGLLFLPVIGLSPNTLILISSLTAVIVVGAVHIHTTFENNLDYVYGVFGLLFVGFTLVVLEVTDVQIRDTGNTSTAIRTLSWFISCSVLPLPFLGTRVMVNRLFLLAVYYSVPVLLMSTRHEPLTLLLIYIHTGCWLVLEARRSGVNKLNEILNVIRVTRRINKDDARRAAIFVFYLVFSYIATGNYDDVSSFDIQTVRCFTMELNEILMGFLLILKFFLVFVVLVGGYIALSVVTGADPSRSFAFVLLLTNGLGFRFFLEFSEQGTQKEISVSLSRHCFTQAFTFLLTLSYIVAQLVIFRNPINYSSPQVLQERVI